MDVYAILDRFWRNPLLSVGFISLLLVPSGVQGLFGEYGLRSAGFILAAVIGGILCLWLGSRRARRSGGAPRTFSEAKPGLMLAAAGGILLFLFFWFFIFPFFVAPSLAGHGDEPHGKSENRSVPELFADALTEPFRQVGKLIAPDTQVAQGPAQGGHSGGQGTDPPARVAEPQRPGGGRPAGGTGDPEHSTSEPPGADTVTKNASNPVSGDGLRPRPLAPAQPPLPGPQPPRAAQPGEQVWVKVGFDHAVLGFRPAPGVQGMASADDFRSATRVRTNGLIIACGRVPASSCPQGVPLPPVATVLDKFNRNGSYWLRVR